MRFSQDTFTGNSISAYGSGRITIQEQDISHGVIITPKKIIHDWMPSAFTELRQAHLLRLSELEPEIVILGTGESLRFPPIDYTAGLLEQGIGVEIMSTPAACRTFNILLSEERRVVAALLMR